MVCNFLIASVLHVETPLLGESTELCSVMRCLAWVVSLVGTDYSCLSSSWSGWVDEKAVCYVHNRALSVQACLRDVFQARPMLLLVAWRVSIQPQVTNWPWPAKISSLYTSWLIDQYPQLWGEISLFLAWLSPHFIWWLAILGYKCGASHEPAPSNLVWLAGWS